MLIYPKRPGGPSGLIRLGNIGPPSFSIDLFEYHFELDGVLEDNENQLVYDAAHLLGNALSARLLKSA
jgi:hypothetical protein